MSLARKSIDNIISASPMRSIFPATKPPKILAKSKSSKKPQQERQHAKPKPSAPAAKKTPVKKAPAKKKSSKMPNDKVVKGQQFTGIGSDTSNVPAVDLTNLG